jgi:hypothetical protein
MCMARCADALTLQVEMNAVGLIGAGAPRHSTT